MASLPHLLKKVGKASNDFKKEKFVGNIFFVNWMMQKSEKYLPYVLSLLLPGLGILGHNAINSWAKELSTAEIAPKFIVLIPMLFGLWKLNEWIVNRGHPRMKHAPEFTMTVVLIFFNLGYIFLFVLIEKYVLPEALSIKRPILGVGIRLPIAAIMFVMILRGFKAIRERESLRMLNLRLESENIQAQFELLKQQINPHFLFNSLSTLRTMVRTKDEKSEDYILNLANVYRHILKKRDVFYVSLQEELNFLEEYLFMLKARHQEALQIEMEVPRESYALKIPPFALQLLLENCLKHNIASESKPLKVRIYQKEIRSITVENNYQIKRSTFESSGIGLENLRQRYELLQIQDGVSIVQNEKIFAVTLKLFNK